MLASNQRKGARSPGRRAGGFRARAPAVHTFPVPGIQLPLQLNHRRASHFSDAHGLVGSRVVYLWLEIAEAESVRRRSVTWAKHDDVRASHGWRRAQPMTVARHSDMSAVQWSSQGSRWAVQIPRTVRRKTRSMGPTTGVGSSSSFSISMSPTGGGWSHPMPNHPPRFVTLAVSWIRSPTTFQVRVNPNCWLRVATPDGRALANPATTASPRQTEAILSMFACDLCPRAPDGNARCHKSLARGGTCSCPPGARVHPPAPGRIGSRGNRACSSDPCKPLEGWRQAADAGQSNLLH